MLKKFTFVSAAFTTVAILFTSAVANAQTPTPTPTPKNPRTQKPAQAASPSPRSSPPGKVQSKQAEGKPPAPTPTPKSQDQSIVNTSKSNTKDHTTLTPAPTPTPKSQDQSIINTSKSNVKDHTTLTPAATPTATPPKVEGRRPVPTPTPTPRDQSTLNTSKAFIRVGATKDMVMIVLDLPTPQAFAYNPATGAIEPKSGEIQAVVNPIPGIGIVIKKNPGGGASITVPTSGGKGELPKEAKTGTYDLTVQIPQASLPGNPSTVQGKGVTITFAMAKTPGGWVHAKGSGSPKAQGFKNVAISVPPPIPSPTPGDQATADKGWDGKEQGKQVVTALKLTFDKPEDYDNFAAGKLKIHLALKNTISGQTISLESRQLTENFRPAPDKKEITVNVVIDNLSAAISQAPCVQAEASAENAADDSGVNLTLSYARCDSGHPQESAGTPIGGIIVKGGKNPGGNLSIAGDTRIVTKESAASLSQAAGTINVSCKGNGPPKAQGF